MKFSIGQKVRIKEGFQKERYSGDPGVLSDMIVLTGQTVTIRDISEDLCFVEENKWTWSDKWLEEIIEIKDFAESEFDDLFK